MYIGFRLIILKPKPVNSSVGTDMEDFPLKNRIPYQLVNQDGEWLCKWLNTSNIPFAEPFFDETILKLKAAIGSTSFTSVSNLSMMEEWAGNITAIRPSAFIFHTSRCGSTLVSQLLSTSSKHIVLPEVPFFDDLLRLPYRDNDFSKKRISSILSAVANYYAQVRTGHELRLYIKTDSWHMFFHQQLRELYPTVPFVLMYRNPAEIFKSLKKIPGLQSVPGMIEPAVFGFQLKDAIHPDTYIAMVLEAYLQQYLTMIKQDDNILLVNYNEGPMPVLKKIAVFTNTPLSSQDIEVMTERSLYHSKKPADVFSEKMPVDIPGCLDKAMDLYHQLEEKRSLI
jgi:hypothetical protein